MCSAPSLTAFATVLGPCALRFARADARNFGRFRWRAPHRASDTFRLAAERHIIEFVRRNSIASIMKLTGHPKYSAASLAALEKQGRPLNFLYFWGHTNHGRIGKECLSQWSPHSLVIDGRTYRTAEHWMMAQKASLFADSLAYERILKAEQPRDAKALGRTVSNFEPTLWDEHCYSLVRLGNIHKFNQHRSLYEFLLATGDSVIVEASPDDPVWGIALNEADARNVHFTQWQGRNLLGFALMEVRDILHDCGPFHSPSNSMQPPLISDN